MILDAGRPEAIEQAAELIRLGSLVAFPTDTLYGVGADISNPDAIDQLYRAKNRPKDKGIPVLIADGVDVDNIATSIPSEARALIEKFWPGPLTLILQKREDLASGLSPNQGIAVRVPGNLIARRLIRAAGGAIAASSANQSGSDPALTADQALIALRGSIAAVLDGGPVEFGVASTILDFTTHPPRIVRQGPISAVDLEIGELMLA
ncbi:MAG TPA: L-threonylcarbamoyladenylate synthase [candidate division Zixibacteria bacterium]|nr:L-threonylcarbamoyladenylate synthase [candidate division Zixibacteria bacterium]